jgi:PAS domain S-box-containing protein
MAKKIASAPSNLKSKISNPQSLRVLMVEDSEDDALLIIRELKKGGYNPVYERVETTAAMKKALKDKQWDIILCDYKLPKFSGEQAIALLKETNIEIPLIIVSGAIGEETAVECMRSGAHDYIMKNNLSRLCPAIARELEEAKVRVQRKRVGEDLEESENKYRLSFENVTDVIYTIDNDLNILSLSPSVERILGYKPQDFIGRPVSDLGNILTPESFEQAIADISVILKGETIPATIYRFIAKDGTIKYGEVSGSPMMRNGKIIGIISVARDITDRKMAEEKVRESEEKYRTILENIEDGYYEVDLNGNFTFFNASACRILGYPQEEMMGMNNRQFTDKENATKLFKTFNEVYRTGQPAKEFDWQVIRKDGTKRYIEVSVSLQKHSLGKPIGFQGIARDITERKRAEDALQGSEKYFKEITENSSDIIVITDKNGDIKYCSRSTERFTGYKPEELIGRNVIRVIHPDDVKRAVGDFGKAILAKDSAIPNGFRIVHKDGSERYFEGLGKNFLDNPVVAGFIMNVHDITERKQAEEKLRRSEEKYRNIIENMQEGYFELDRAGNFTFVNEAECRNLGYPREELIGMNNRHYQDETTAQKTYQLFIRLYRTGEPVKASDVEIIRKNGTKGFNEISVSLIRDPEGKPIGFRGISRDITERKQAEEERKQSFERMRKALGATVQSISMIVEMRDPYTSGHQQRVSDLARSIATEMGLSADRKDFIRTASAIHDIGKISIPSEILSKPTKLTDLEFRLIKTHSQSGYDILKDIEFPWPVADVVLQHHERMNGSGYPQGLKGDDILLEARILAIADVVEAIASHRPYRPALGIDLAMKEISGNKGILYDADVVDACLKLFQEKGYTLVLKKL